MFQPGRTASMWNWCMQASFGIAPLCLVVEASHAFRHHALESNQLICVQSFSLHIFSCTSSQCQHLQEQQSHREWSARCLHLRIETRCTCPWIAPLHVMCYQIILWHLRFLKSLLHDGPSSPAVSSVAASASSEKQCVESKAETIPGPCDGDKPRSKKIVYFDLDSILDFQAIQTQAGAEKPPDPMSNFRKRPNYDGSRRKLLKVDKDRRSQLGVTYYYLVCHAWSARKKLVCMFFLSSWRFAWCTEDFSTCTGRPRTANPGNVLSDWWSRNAGVIEKIAIANSAALQWWIVSWGCCTFFGQWHALCKMHLIHGLK